MNSSKSFALFAVAILSVASLAVVFYKEERNSDISYDELYYFYEICNVPRMSGYNEKIGDYLISFAEEHGYEYEMDSVGNIRIDHPGNGSHYKVILQAHMDMVPALAPGFQHNFTTDPIQPFYSGGWIAAYFTSLGADDGSGMAIALNALDSEQFDGYDFRCIFTVDEETSMIGAETLDPSWLQGYDCLINIDNDYEGQILIGCAGTSSYDATLTPEFTDTSKNGFEIAIYGLTGGHSGDCIDFPRANAIILALDVLKSIDDVELADIRGGEVKNSIPTSCIVKMASNHSLAEIQELLNAKVIEWERTYTDDAGKIKAEVVNSSGITKSISNTDTKALIDKLLSVPNGVYLKTEEEFLIASCNFGVISFMKGNLTIEAMARSADDGIIDIFDDKFRELFPNVTISGKSPSWLDPSDTELISVSKKVYSELFGKELTIDVTHAGLETGYFREKNTTIQMISVGPDIVDCHLPGERMNVESFHRTKLFVFGLLERLMIQQ